MAVIPAVVLILYNADPIRAGKKSADLIFAVK